MSPGSKPMDGRGAIRARRSVRSYLPEPLGADERAAVERALAESGTGPFGTRVRFALVEIAQGEQKLGGRALWTYGAIDGATTFVAGAVDPSRAEATFDFGHCLERVILAATQAGLGTCWLGGTFRASAFGERMGLSAGEVIPCVTPVGRAAQKRSLVDRAFRTFAGSDHRKPWAELFFEAGGERPLAPGDAGRFSEPLECLRLAPSASNKQPWRVFKDASGGGWVFGLARNAAYDRAVSPVSLQEIDLGIGMCHFELACRELGLAGKLAREPRMALPNGVEFVARWVAG